MQIIWIVDCTILQAYNFTITLSLRGYMDEEEVQNGEGMSKKENF